MSVHQGFYEYLGQMQPNGPALQDVYNQYKNADNASAFELNGRLTKGQPLTQPLEAFRTTLREIIRARNKTAIKLYRMTSDAAFPGELKVALQGQPFTHPAFLSTAGTMNVLHTFTPNEGTPILMEINCPPNTAMALMESSDGLEDEYLLGCETRFEVLQVRTVTDPELMAACLSIGHKRDHIIRIEVNVVANPPYSDGLSPWFFDQDPPPEVEYL